eukprot:TRINITY_DN57937_c0_g1_i1.p1 TRINITY_DN57937_c0_g1~~TRINITY_DN57937_c0_g1_i1.p1  ORF type:complete len:126 (+),score=29.69 TRINITY_DN57937_c0_g1_i1:78-455(+)
MGNMKRGRDGRVRKVCFFFFKQKTAYEMLRSLVGSEMCIRDRLSSCTCVSGGGVLRMGRSSATDSNRYTRIRLKVAYLDGLGGGGDAWTVEVTSEHMEWLFERGTRSSSTPVSYTHLTLPTKRIV